MVSGNLTRQFLTERAKFFQAAEFWFDPPTIQPANQVHQQRLGTADGHAGDEKQGTKRRVWLIVHEFCESILFVSRVPLLEVVPGWISVLDEPRLHAVLMFVRGLALLESVVYGLKFGNVFRFQALAHERAKVVLMRFT